MRIEAASERRMMIDPFSNRSNAGKMPEEMAEVKAGIDEKVEKMLEIYQDLRIHNEFAEDTEERLSELDYETLAPHQIDLLLQRMIKTTDEEKINDLLTGIYISNLIQISYENGNNDFQLIMQETKISKIGYNIIGKANNPLRLTIIGDTDSNLGSMSNRCIYDIKGNTGSYCGLSSENCIYTIEGRVGHSCGDDSERCTYTIKGTVGYACGWFAEKCTYRTSDKNAYIMMTVFVAGGDNRVQLIDKEGNIIKERRRWG